jgi:MFS superfamily sulfate permease-like transporter
VSAAAVGALGLLVILVLRQALPKVLAVLVVVLSIGAADLLHIDERGVDLVGVLPQGFPPLTIPSVGLSELPLLAPGALGIAVDVPAADHR